MSRKTVSFSVPAAAPAPRRGLIEAQSDDWVSDRHDRSDETTARPAAPSLILDLAAERSLIEVFALSMLAPFALGWFWLVRAMAGRARF